MKTTNFDERFFESTRGRVVEMLRGTTGTVGELAQRLGLTDNAVRAHLLSLERDGLVRQSGVQRGFRKPHFAYELTPEAELLFPKAYDAMLNGLIAALKGRLPPETLEEVLREVGCSLAADQAPGDGGGLRERVERAAKVLKALGGSPLVEGEGRSLLIQSGSCPMAAAVAEHPEVCGLAEGLVAEIVGAPVSERCDRSGLPKCCFEVEDAE